MDSIGENPSLSKLYNLTKSLTMEQRPIYPLLDKTTGNSVHLTKAKAQLLEDHFEQHFRPFPVVDQEHNSLVKHKVQEILQTESHSDAFLFFQRKHSKLPVDYTRKGPLAWTASPTRI